MWFIYAVMVGDKIDYIGMTRDLYQRGHLHQSNRYIGHYRLDMRVLQRARTLETARRHEQRLIRRHRPPGNVLHNPDRKSVVEKIDTYCINPHGEKKPIRFHRREGMMHPD